MSHESIKEDSIKAIAEYVDELTGTIWRGAYLQGVVEVPGEGIFTAPEPVASAEDYTFRFAALSNNTLKVVRKITLNDGKVDKEKYLAAVSPNGDIAMVSRRDSDEYDGDIDLEAGTITFLRTDQGRDSDPFRGSQTSVYSIVLVPDLLFGS
jgi:hypothetical protein